MFTDLPVRGSIGGSTRLKAALPVPLVGSQSTAHASSRAPCEGWLGYAYQSTLPVGSIAALIANTGMLKRPFHWPSTSAALASVAARSLATRSARLSRARAFGLRA